MDNGGQEGGRAVNQRENLQRALRHEEGPLPVDFAGTAGTGMHVSAVTRLRRAVLGDPDYRVKVIEPYQMLGEIDAPLRDALGIGVVGLSGRTGFFGFENKGWKPFTMFDGTPVQVPEDFRVTTDPDGSLLMYPQGDLSAAPSGRMPRGGHFFDTLVRQPPLDESRLDPRDNMEEFVPFSEEDLAWYVRGIEALHEGTTCGIAMMMPGTAFGDIACVPAPWMKRPKGIRDIEEWYVSTALRTDYVRTVFERQCEVGLQNIETLIRVLGDRVQAVWITGTDFGTQRGPFISVQAYRDLFKPYHVRVNRLIHAKSQWKSLIHSCGSIRALLPDFVEAGFDVLNPVQCSAANMDARALKREFGQQLVFWGGGVDTQKTLPFGTPDDVYREVRERIEIFAPGGGFVFAAVHNVQANTPVANILAMFKAIKDSAR
jgi:hypothetical protein